MLAGTLSGVEMGLRVAGVPHRAGGVMAALEFEALARSEGEVRTPGSQPDAPSTSTRVTGCPSARTPNRSIRSAQASRPRTRPEARDVAGEVRFDRGSRALYATDASNYRQVPIGLVVPRDADDVVGGGRGVPAISARRSCRGAPAPASPASAATSPWCSTSRST